MASVEKTKTVAKAKTSTAAPPQKRGIPIPSPFERVHTGPLTEELLLEPGKFGLGMVPGTKQPNATTTMACGFCSTGCGLNVHLADGQAVNLTPAVNYPVNLGMACPKGWEALAALPASDRGTTPLIRTNGKLQPASWQAAMETFCDSFKSIQQKHGKDSVAFLGTGQLPSEELAFLGALAKFGMGMVHGDGNTRQCMATAVTAYKQSFGFDAPPYTYDDFEQSDVLVLVGSNLCIAHPIMWQRVLRNKNNPEIIVLDPRCTETADAATEHVALAPKSDLALLYGIANLLISKGAIDQRFIDQSTSDFEGYQSHVKTWTPEVVSRVSGISTAQLHRVADKIAAGKRVSFWWTMGINQSYEGTRAAQAIINLALMTGNIGRPGTGANSITGQCNAMGSRLFSNTTNLLGAHSFDHPEHRRKVAAVLGIEESTIPQETGDTYDKIMAGIAEGRIRGLWVLGTNMAHSWIHQSECRRLLDKLDFLVVQDMYHSTETVAHCDLYLPAAGWGEKEGTFINSERRIGLLKKVSRAPGQALADFSIFQLVANYWGCGQMFERWTDPEAAFQLLKQLTAGQPCDITGIESYRMLDEHGGIQWPYPQDNPDTGQQRRLFADGRFFHKDGKARFIYDAPQPMPEPTSDQWPFLLMTGRGTAAQWHTQTRTGKSSVLRKLYPAEVYVEIHPLDAAEMGIAPDQKVTVLTARGSVTANAFITPTVNQKQLFMPMHYVEVNQLTMAHFDPWSKQPSYKDCAAKIEV